MKISPYAAIGAIGLLVVAGLLATPFQVVLLTRAFVWAMLGLSAWFLLRVSGRSSLGTAAFFGVAAYATGLSATRWHHHNFWIVLAISIAAAAVVGLVVGLVSGRLSGIHFLLITLAFAELLRSLSTRWRALGGDDGIAGITRPKAGLLGLDLRPPANLMWFTGGWLLVVATALVVIVRSPFGAALIGTRDSESRMAAFGYSSSPYRVAAVVIAAVVAGIAGTLNAFITRFVSPAEYAPLVSAKALLFTAIGGASMIGAVLAAIVLTFLEDFLSSRFSRWLLILGVLYVAIAMLGSGNIARMRAAVRRRVGTRDDDATTAEEPHSIDPEPVGPAPVGPDPVGPDPAGAAPRPADAGSLR